LDNLKSLSDEQIGAIVGLALAEDISLGDVTTRVLVSPRLRGQASVLVKENGVLAGGGVARRVFLEVDPSLKVEVLVGDGAGVQSGQIIATVSGSVASILKAERVALNFLQRLSGIASQTARYVAETQGFGAVIMDTRKTTPGLRLLEKYAVRMGGGYNHRFHLADGILIKDNHLVALRASGMCLRDVVARAKKGAPEGLVVEVEVTAVEEAAEAVEAGADVIKLDNMSPDEMRRVVDLVSGQARIEASGGITLDNVREVAATGVDIISVGALTHSPRALDISLELEPGTLEAV